VAVAAIAALVGGQAVGGRQVTVFVLLGTVALAAGGATARVTQRVQMARLADTDQRLTALARERASAGLERDCFIEVLDATNVAVIAMSLAGTITGWNRAAAELYGYNREEALDQSVAVLNPGAAFDLLESMAGVRPGWSTSFETVHLRKDGSPVEVSLTVTRTVDRPGKPGGVLVVAHNLTAQKALDAEIHEQSKLESLGRLAAGLAHEINTPIQYVGDNARFLEEAYQELIRVVEVYRGLLDTSNPIGWLERQERVREAEAGIDFDYLQEEIPSAVEQTLQGIDRVSTIVRAMKTFSHPGHEEKVPADLNEALSAAVTVTRHQVSDVADLRLDLGDLPPVRCNIADLNQVFLNLIVNAADAIEETGRRGLITVVTATEGANAVVRISDTGCGIPEDVRSRMFDPFFTTKEVGRGSGQGLPLVRGVVQDAHGGSLTVDSVVGKGTTFSVRIPIDGAVRPSPDEAATVGPRSASSAELVTAGAMG
jgi:PAS domain S-box-containing protein